MLKLLMTYRAEPTLKNAQKVRAYAQKHPFAVCLIEREDAELIAMATNQAEWGNAPQLSATLGRS